MPTPEPRAVLWDMDGTLLDSAEYHWRTWQEVLEPEGHILTRDRFTATFGRRNQAVLRELLGRDVPESEMTRIETTKEARYRELVRTGGIKPLPGVVDWLARLRDAGWRQAIASSAPRLNIATILETLGLAAMFDAVAGSEDVTRGKPDPQIFLVAAAKLDLPPARCIVVEDALAGVEAAHQAGMRCIGVGPSHTTLPADVTVPSLVALPSDVFDRLVPAR
jgi:beta-phosphoglucomutase family hydrolase